jgi:hypothetical protein
VKGARAHVVPWSFVLSCLLGGRGVYWGVCVHVGWFVLGVWGCAGRGIGEKEEEEGVDDLILAGKRLGNGD